MSELDETADGCAAVMLLALDGDFDFHERTVPCR